MFFRSAVMSTPKRKGNGESETPAKRPKKSQFSQNEIVYFFDIALHIYLIIGPTKNDQYPVFSIGRASRPHTFKVVGERKYRRIPDSANRITTLTIFPGMEAKKYEEKRWFESSVEKPGDKSVFDTIVERAGKGSSSGILAEEKDEKMDESDDQPGAPRSEKKSKKKSVEKKKRSGSTITLPDVKPFHTGQYEGKSVRFYGNRSKPYCLLRDLCVIADVPEKRRKKPSKLVWHFKLQKARIKNMEGTRASYDSVVSEEMTKALFETNKHFFGAKKVHEWYYAEIVKIKTSPIDQSEN